MNRGYIKFWRKSQDSSSWNRGLMYQGLIINLLSRAAWKKGSYQGRDILPGQFGTVLNNFAESLDVPRSTFKRMVAHLVEDDFIRVQNVGHRFSIITIVNWERYQSPEDAAWATDGPPVVHQRAAGGPPSYNVEEVKKEEVKNINTPPHPPLGVTGEVEPLSDSLPQGRKQRQATGNTAAELRQVIAGYSDSEPLRQALEDFRQMRERIRKPMTGRALKLLLGDLNKLAPDEFGKIAVLEQSIKNSWQGVFELKQPARASPGQKTYFDAQMDAAMDGFDRLLAQDKERKHGQPAL